MRPGSLVILGMQILGAHASDVIAECTLAVQQGVTAEELYAYNSRSPDDAGSGHGNRGGAGARHPRFTRIDKERRLFRARHRVAPFALDKEGSDEVRRNSNRRRRNGAVNCLRTPCWGMKKLLLLEQHTLGHDRAASTDWTRAIRYEYAEQELYSRMVGRSIEHWRDLERSTRGDLYVECGSFAGGATSNWFARRSYLVLKEMGIPIEKLDSSALGELFPQFDCSRIAYATYNPQGGFLQGVRLHGAFASEVRRMGGEIREGTPLRASKSAPGASWSR